MKFSSSFLSSVYLAVVCASGALAAPWEATSKLPTHRVRALTPTLSVETYHPPSTYETYGAGEEHALTRRADATIEDSTRSFIASKLGVSNDDIHFRSGYEADTAHHGYAKQYLKGVPVANAVANVAFSKDNKVVAFGSSFVKPKSVASSTPKISAKDAITKAEGLLDGKYNDHPTTLEYVVKEDHSAVLTHVVQIQNEKTGAWYEGFINAETGELETVTDFVSHATFRVLPITKEILTEGFETLTNPEDTTASPYGWLSTDGSTQSTTTQGNNAYSYVGSTPASQSSSGSFVYTQVPGSAPSVAANKNAAIVNAFYAVNEVHDVTYRYGFTEKAYNFQQNNRGVGGAANDRVKISVQDSGGIDNANFATPADGQSGQMRMYLWDYTNPERDGALENDIVIHENTHGVSNRLTGGGTGRCLQGTESGGLGEGWSDALADWFHKTDATTPDFVMGQYVTAIAKGIRSYPYSTSATTNPYRYSTVKTKNEVHAIGEVWANVLHNVYAALVSNRGFSATAKTDPTSTAGNSVWLHLFLDAMALQPCNPTFLTARDAWIQADVNRYAGANKCTLWNAFASRGFGTGAASYTDSSAVPSGC